MFVLLYKYVIFALFMLNITPFQANVLFPYHWKRLAWNGLIIFFCLDYVISFFCQQ